MMRASDNSQIKYVLLLMLAALVWGSAFVAQRVGMDEVGPITFLAVRYIISGVALLPLALYRRHKGASDRTGPKEERVPLLAASALCGAALCVASAAQQVGILYTTVGKAGFLTALYIIIVPFLSVALGKRLSSSLWVSVALALVGMYLLCLSGLSGVNKGDLLCLLCAFLFSVQILLIDRFSPSFDGVALACGQFFFCGLFATVIMLLTERPTLSGLISATIPILYAGLLSGAVGYTLQIIGQKHLDSTVASLAMSLESVFSALSGWVILGEALTGRELIGCALMFAAIILAQLPNKRTGKG